ncbi:hypothetical protein Tco_1271601, partial [Tanacetum coccineum]
SWVRDTKDIRIEIIVVNLDSNSDSYITSQISTSEEIDYDSPELPKSLLKWYHYLSDEYKDNGRAQASEASSKDKVEACGSKVKVEAYGSKAKLQASTKTLIVKIPVPITNCVLELANAITWNAIKGKTFGVQIPPTMTFAEVKIGKRNLRKIIEISSNNSEDRKWASKATALIFYGPSTQGLLDAYGYNTIEEYLSWNYFPSTYNESTDMETTYKRNTDKDCIVDSNSAMSKACTLHLQLAYAHCICTLHLQLAFASKHLHIALAHCICRLKGLDVPFMLCLNNGNAVESHNHLFFSCSMALDLFQLLGRRLDDGISISLI